jgi:glycosyltransferase involved in cell wall biosynthesis
LWKGLIPRAQLALEELRLRRVNAHVVHSPYYRTYRFLSQPLIVTVYDMIYEKFAHEYFPHEDRFRAQKRSAIMAADVVIAISETTRDDIMDVYGGYPGKVRVVGLGCGEAFLAAPRTGNVRTPEFPYVMYVGSRNLYKGFDTLLSAFAAWPRNKEIHLVVVGGQWTEGERAVIALRGIEASINLVEAPGDAHLAALYRGAHALIFPSLYEGFGLPLLEGMACGCPIVASRIPSTLEVAGKLPFYFKAGDWEDLLGALEEALGQKDLSRRKAAMEMVASRSWADTARKTLMIYHELANL